MIAGAVEVFYLRAAGQVPFVQTLRYLAPTLARNIVGGVALTAALNHAQTLAPRWHGAIESRP